MVADKDFTDDRNTFLESIAAQLTEAAYPIVLRHGIGATWLDLKLDLWKVMTESIRRLEPSVSDRLRVFRIDHTVDDEHFVRLGGQDG